MSRARQRACLELSSIREALAELERLGLVAKTGEMRNGTSCQESGKYDGLYRRLAAHMGTDPSSIRLALKRL
jgi:DNA-binding FadR family transcriptional regulator